MSLRLQRDVQLQVGTIASLALDDSIAMRVRFEGPRPLQPELYFRGPVLSTFDGREWRPLRSGFPQRMQMPANLQTSGSALLYQVTLEPNNRPWLLVLDASATQPALPGYSLSMTPELQWVADRPIADIVRYTAQSHVDFRHGPLRASANQRSLVAESLATGQ